MCFLYGWIPLAYFKLRLRGVFESTYKQFWSKAIASLVPKDVSVGLVGLWSSRRLVVSCGMGLTDVDGVTRRLDHRAPHSA